MTKIFTNKCFFIGEFIKTQKNITNGFIPCIILFYIKYFSRIENLVSNHIYSIQNGIKLNVQYREDNILKLYYNKVPEFVRKNLSYFNLLARNFCNMFFSLKHQDNLSNKKILDKEIEYNGIIRKKEKMFRNIYSIKNLAFYTLKNSKTRNETLEKKAKEHYDFKNIFKNDESLFNFPVFLSKFNVILNIYNLKGFTRNAFENLVKFLNKECKKLILNLGKLVTSRQKKKDLKIEEWGRRNVHIVSKYTSLNNSRIEKSIKQEKLFNEQISFFRKKKKTIIIGKPKLTSIDKNDNKDLSKEKGKSQNDNFRENLKKTNRTLLALLNGILQRRIHILRDATKCLHRYKPLFSKINFKNINTIVSENKKINNEKVQTHDLSIVSIENIWCTGKDCLNLLNFEPNINTKEYFMKWFLCLCNDYNFPNNDEKRNKIIQREKD
nr:hypothetical protein 1634Bnrm3_p004 [Cryptomonas sp.]